MDPYHPSRPLSSSHPRDSIFGVKIILVPFSFYSYLRYEYNKYLQQKWIY
ncbi:hypothetical protein PORCRE_2027 [Porphyromonas crevioricanis JCM 15906]|uniref:Uncharacterized protein n=1 Tax=Porphyromonas crevioricanis JCM 15906 TaxID=1305617 RepID=T1CJ65_9PORP|nr:hypothetical protein PORCRE_2027 [Porphyromonas crevioricanis JCM 15906]GAD06729.1 hypothetical protein PORCAN_330 [Porphyromonas crevioricanis JCM 13913]